MALMATTDFRRSNHERSRLDSLSCWIDDYLPDVDDFLHTQIENGELGLLHPFEENDAINSVLAVPDHFVHGFSDPFGDQLFDFEPNDLLNIESEDTAYLTPSSSSSDDTDYPPETPRTPEPAFEASPTSTAKHISTPTSTAKHISTPKILLHSASPTSTAKHISTPTKRNPATTAAANPPTPGKWFGAHTPMKLQTPPRSHRASNPKTVSESSEKIRLDGILVSPSSHSSKVNQKIVSRALLEKLKAASKRNARQSILLPVPEKDKPNAPKYHVYLDHDYCIDRTRFEKDDFEVQPMELEPEHEKSNPRIEVLPDLSLVAREKKKLEQEKMMQQSQHATRNPRSLLKVNQISPIHQELEIVQVTDYIEEEVVASEGGVSSDSGVESVGQSVEGVENLPSRRRWKEERSRKRRRRSSSSSTSGSSRSVSSERRRSSESTRRKERKRSRSGTRSRNSKRDRSYSRGRSQSRCSSPDYSIGSESSRQAGWTCGEPRKPERKNPWAMDTFEGVANRTPVKKTAMQVALEKIRRGGDRPILYVGAIPEGTTRDQLRERFAKFGPIAEVSVHFRDTGENYGFVTFVHAKDAYEARDHANDDRTLPFLKLSFGGRRQFCGQQWADLDGQQEKEYLREGVDDLVKRNDDFDSLLSQLKRR